MVLFLVGYYFCKAVVEKSEDVNDKQLQDHCKRG